MINDVAHTEPTRAKANGIEIVYDTFGDTTSAPLLLIMGLGGQMIEWEKNFVRNSPAEATGSFDLTTVTLGYQQK